jgi:hypothetical protein
MSHEVKIRGRLAFANLFDPKPVGDGGPRYSASILFDPNGPHHKAVLEAVTACATAKWGAKAPAILKSMFATSSGCLQNGDAKAQYAGFEGQMFVSAGQPAEKGPPDVRNQQGKRANPGDPTAPYSGCYVEAKLDLWPQDNQYGKKINASIISVQFWKAGEAFGGGTRATSDDEFEDLSAEEESDIA